MKKKFITVGALLAALFIIGFIMCKYIDVSYFLSKKEVILQLINKNYILSFICFIALYALLVISTLPLSALFTIVGGFLFGMAGGVIGTVIGAVLGAVASFLFFKYFLAKDLHKKYDHKMEKFNREIKKYGARYLIVIHLLMIVPFFLINLFSALANVPLTTFIWTTIVGIMPSTLLYAYAGSQLNYIDSIKDIFSWKIILALVILIAVVLITVLRDKIVHAKSTK